MLSVLQQSEEYELAGLVTTFNEAADRVAMHAVRRELVEQQAHAIGLPLFPIRLPWPCSNEEYERRMSQFIESQADRGVTHFAFGDLYLEDIRDYRIRQLDGSGIEPIFPIWCGREGTAGLAEEMIQSGLRAVLTCVDTSQLSAEFSGRLFDRQLLSELPDHVDPCGENGEFHTFCFAGPHQPQPIDIDLGETRNRDGFLFCDVIPTKNSSVRR